MATEKKTPPAETPGESQPPALFSQPLTASQARLCAADEARATPPDPDRKLCGAGDLGGVISHLRALAVELYAGDLSRLLDHAFAVLAECRAAWVGGLLTPGSFRSHGEAAAAASATPGDAPYPCHAAASCCDALAARLEGHTARAGLDHGHADAPTAGAVPWSVILKTILQILALLGK